MTIPFSYSTPEKVDTRAVDTRAKVIKFIQQISSKRLFKMNTNCLYFMNCTVVGRSWAQATIYVTLAGGGRIEYVGGAGFYPNVHPPKVTRDTILIEENDLHHPNKQQLDDLLYNMVPLTESEAVRDEYYRDLGNHAWR